MRHITNYICFSLGKYSFKRIIVFFFIITSSFPILLLQVASYGYFSESFQESIDQMVSANAIQTGKNLNNVLEDYDDLLYQVYTDDDMIENIINIDSDNNLAMNMNRLRGNLRTICYAKEGIEASSILTPKGNLIHYDKLTASSVNSSWISNVGWSEKDIYSLGISDYETHILPTHYARTQLTKPNYLFHMVHQIINYKKIEQPAGVVILSLNENLLEEICRQDLLENSYSYIVSENGRIISHQNKDKIGIILPDFYNAAVAEGLSSDISIYVSEPVRSWNVVTIVDKQPFWNDLFKQLANLVLIGLGIMAVSLLAVISVTGFLSHSMDKVIAAMRQAQKGNLGVTVEETGIASREMLSIVHTFNKMMRKISELVEEVKSATNRKKDAVIKALESQVNPHSLYNVLDSINWMSIENDQFEISHMVTSLAKILRYSINNSNAMVSLRDELEWLRQYIYLQSIRFKDSFEYTLEVAEPLLDLQVHKLFLQPFVENAIVHGFKGSQRKNLLSIYIYQENGDLHIIIQDNGKGIEPEVLESLFVQEVNSGDHLGMVNAIGRIKIYYGEESQVSVKSDVGIGTTVSILLKGHGRVQNENCNCGGRDQDPGRIDKTD